MKRLLTICRRRPKTALLAVSLIGTLAACGGSPSDSQPSEPVSAQTAAAASANSAVIPAAAAGASTAVLATAEAAVASAGISIPFNCPGGGTAVYTVSGGVMLANNRFDQGEVYSFTFLNCGTAAGSTINGTMTLTVLSAAYTGSTLTEVTVNTSTNNLSVLGAAGNGITFDGTSTIARTVATVGTTTTTTTHWTSSGINLAVVRNNRSSSFTLSNVDLIRTVVVNNGVVTSVSCNGTVTLTAQTPNGSFTVTFTAQGAIYDAGGTPTQGTWTITLANNSIVVTITGGMVEIKVDFGNDGSFDKTYPFTIANFVAEAG
jgi:hypothetical protein